MRVHKYYYQIHEDAQGMLVAIEEEKDIPFRIKRVYYMYGAGDAVIRGRHAHKSLQQILICVHGNCKIRLDDGRERKIISLNHPNEGLYIPHLVWREIFDFAPDTVLLVLASDVYDKSDYIRDYEEFIKYVSDQEETDVDADNDAR